MALTDTVCRNAKPAAKAWKLADGLGLYLFVKPGGGKLWRLDYAHAGKRKTASFGAYPQVSLALARAKRDDVKAALKEGRDPAAKPADDRPTFEQVAREWFKGRAKEWRPSYSTRFWSRVEAGVLPYIGSRPIADIQSPEIIDLLRKIETRGAVYTAKRTAGIISNIFRYAIAGNIVKSNPAADIGAALRPTPREQNFTAVKEAHLPAFFRRLNAAECEEQTILAVKLVAHTFLRSNEARFGKWAEIDWKAKLWSIDGERMKMRKDHLVPLSRQVLDILARLRSVANGSEWILPGRGGLKPISENTMIYCLYRAGLHSRATIHGLRATASTILNDSGLWRADAIERQLSHVSRNEIRGVYNRALYLEERTAMMQHYSDLLDKHEKAGLARDLSDVLA